MKRIFALLFSAALMFGGCDYKIDYSEYYHSMDETYTAVPANDFIASIGVNSSINSRGEYIEKTLDCMTYLGARWIRSGYGGTIDDQRYLWEKAGIRFSLVLGTQDGTLAPEWTIEGARQVARMGALIAREGVNEPNNWTVKYKDPDTGEIVESGGSLSWKALAQAHADFYRLAKEDDILKDYPVWSISEPGAEHDNVGMQFLTIPEGANTVMPEGTAYADCANCHNYIVHPGWPGVHNNQTWLTSDPTSNSPLDGLYDNFGLTWGKNYEGYDETTLKTLRRVTTETGTTINESVSEEMQGLLYLNLYLCQFKRGWEYTSMYILRDRVDEAGNQTFGFFGRDYKPRIAAHYLHNLTTILADNESIDNPSTLSYSIRNKPNTVPSPYTQPKSRRNPRFSDSCFPFFLTNSGNMANPRSLVAYVEKGRIMSERRELKRLGITFFCIRRQPTRIFRLRKARAFIMHGLYYFCCFLYTDSSFLSPAIPKFYRKLSSIFEIEIPKPRPGSFKKT